MTDLNLKNTQADQTSEFQVNRWRPQLLMVLLRIASLLGLFLLVLIIRDSTANQRVIFGVVYLVLLGITLIPLQYRIKAGTLLLIGYFVGFYTLLIFGPWSDAIVFFVATSTLAALLFDKKVDLWIAGVNTITLIGIGLLNILGISKLLSPEIPPTDLMDWAKYIIDYAAVMIPLVWAVNLLKREFRTVADRSKASLKLLAKDKEELEQRIEERTFGLIKKTEQLQAASYIIHQTAEVQDLPSLLSIVTRLITDQFGFYHTGIFLVNETGDYAILQAASSEGGQRLIEKGHSLAVGTQDIVGYAAAQKTPRIALDVGTDAVFFNNPDLPMTRSEVALPLLIRNKVLGVLDIQSDKPQAFSADEIDVLQTLADQVAVAIENVRLLDETQTALMQLEAVSSVRTREAWSQKLGEKSRVFTYTPLGLRAEKPSESKDKAISFPILLRGQKIGNISIARKGEATWNKLDEDLLEEVATQVGLAIDNIRLLEDATQRAKQEQTVGRLATRFGQSLDIDSLLQTAAREFGQLPDISEVSVFVSQQTEQVILNRGYRFDTVQIEPIHELPALGGQALTSGTIISSNGNDQDSKKSHAVAIPIKVRGQAIGVVSLKLKEDSDETTMAIVESATERLAAVMESARLYEEARLRADREQSISRITSAISASSEYEQILQTTIREIGTILSDTEVTIQILDQAVETKPEQQGAQ